MDSLASTGGPRAWTLCPFCLGGARIAIRTRSIIDNSEDPEWSHLTASSRHLLRVVPEHFFPSYFFSVIMDEMKASECCLLLRAREEEKEQTGAALQGAEGEPGAAPPNSPPHPGT